MNDQVTKPINVVELFATLTRWIRPEAAPLLEVPARELARVEGLAKSQILPEFLPGIDLKRALATLESPVLLRKLLQSFRRENLSLLDELQAALAGGEQELARRLVHTVKGVGGNLGALELGEAARALEPALRQGGAALDWALEVFAGRLNQVLASVLLLGGETEPASEDPEGESAAVTPLQREAIGPLAGKLSGLLQTDNLNALGVWEELKPLLPAEESGELDHALQGLDFREASRVLVELAQALEIEL
jgi:HPt (histidine-containing phosphotransfer) domain-containing protein